MLGYSSSSSASTIDAGVVVTYESCEKDAAPTRTGLSSNFIILDATKEKNSNEINNKSDDNTDKKYISNGYCIKINVNKIKKFLSTKVCQAGSRTTI